MVNFYFFPFTFMDAGQAKALSSFFNKLSVLDIHGGQTLPKPMADLEGKGMLVRVCPDMETLTKAEQKARTWLEWAAIHKGNHRNLGALIREKVFLKDDSGVTAIQAGIRGGIASHKDSARPHEDDGIESLVFLKLADTHDRESRDIQNALDALDRENAALLAELKGDDEDDAVLNDHVQTFEPGQSMTDKRIQAWFRAAVDAQLFEQGGIPVLVTTSKAVMEQFLTGPDQAINGLDNDCIKVHHNNCELTKQLHLKIQAIIEQMAQGLSPGTGDAFFDDAGQSPETATIQIRFFQGLGAMNLTEINPGGQIGVCLVQLNS